MMTEWPEREVPKSWLRTFRDEIEAVDGVDDQGGVHDRAVDDRLGRKGLQAGLDEAIAAALGVLQLDQLDGRGADVETYEVLGFPEQHAYAPPKEFKRFRALTYGLFRLRRQSSRRLFSQSSDEKGNTPPAKHLAVSRTVPGSETGGSNGQSVPIPDSRLRLRCDSAEGRMPRFFRPRTVVTEGNQWLNTVSSAERPR